MIHTFWSNGACTLLEHTCFWNKNSLFHIATEIRTGHYRWMKTNSHTRRIWSDRDPLQCRPLQLSHQHLSPAPHVRDLIGGASTADVELNRAMPWQASFLIWFLGVTACKATFSTGTTSLPSRESYFSSSSWARIFLLLQASLPPEARFFWRYQMPALAMQG
jgi:hypothetical protein